MSNQVNVIVTGLVVAMGQFGWAQSPPCVPAVASPVRNATPSPTPNTPQTPAAPNPEPLPEQAAAFPPQEAGTESPSGGFAPQMIGDFLGGQVTRNLVVSSPVQGTQTVGVVGVHFAVYTFNGTNPTTLTVQSPDVARGAFKIADNESPEPQDRVFASYEHFTGVRGTILGGQTAPFTPNNVIASLGPLLPAAPVGATTIAGPSAFRFDVDQGQIGFEKTFLDGRASIGMRLPFVSAGGGGGNFSGNINQFDPGLATGVPVVTQFSLAGGFAEEASEVGDLSIVLKYALWRDPSSGTLVSAGLVVTTPTAHDVGGLNPTILQPWGGFIWGPNESFYAQGFTSIAVPTDSRDATIWFNDLGVGVWLFRDAERRWLSGVSPTAEVHFNNGLNHTNANDLVQFSDQVVFTGGVHLLLTPRALLSVAVSVPVTGPRPYQGEIECQLNYRF